MDFSKTTLLHGFAKVVSRIAKKQKTNSSLTKISKLVEASALNQKCWNEFKQSAFGHVKRKTAQIFTSMT